MVAGAPPASLRHAVTLHRFAIVQDDPESFIHNDAVARLGFDPVMTLFVRNYVPVARGPDGTVLLEPKGGPRDGLPGGVRAARIMP